VGSRHTGMSFVNTTLWPRAAKRALIAMAIACLAGGTASAGGSTDAYTQALIQGYRQGGTPVPARAPRTTPLPDRLGHPAATPGKAPAEAPVKPPASARQRDPAQAKAVDCLTAAVYYEARGEQSAGQAAVAQVVLNRTRRAGYPKSVCGVVYERAGRRDCQFSFVCNGAMRRTRERTAWVRSRQVAVRALAGHVMKAVGRATCFHALPRREARADGVKLGHQVFYAAK